MSSATEAMDSTDSSSEDRVLVEPTEVAGEVCTFVGALEFLVGDDEKVLVALFSLV